MEIYFLNLKIKYACHHITLNGEALVFYKTSKYIPHKH